MKASLDMTHLYELAKTDESMIKCIEFVKVMVDNPKLLKKFVETGYFFASHHYVQECQNQQCNDCYSGDTEHEQNEALVSACKDIFQLMPKPIHDNTDAEDDSEE